MSGVWSVSALAATRARFRQLCTYELGGLESFLGELASGRLTDAALLARAWAGARMGGYRLGRHGSLVARDLRANRDVALLDLGADTSAQDGWVIGRLVPSGTTPGLMFDTRPVAVDEQTALEVASSDTRGGWVSAVKSALVEGRLERDRFESSDLELATDVLESGTRRDRRLGVRHLGAGGCGHVRPGLDGAVRRRGGARPGRV